MSYEFNPMTEEEINATNLMEEGIYNFEVVKSINKISKSGNNMCELSLTVWDKEGKQHFLFDYLVFSSVPLNIKKIKHFCDSTGLVEEYKRGALPEDLERLSGKLNIGIREKQPNNNGGFYPEKNFVIDYVVTEKNEKQYMIKEEDFNDDKEIPF